MRQRPISCATKRRSKGERQGPRQQVLELAKINNIGNELTAVVVPMTSWEPNPLELLFFLWGLPVAANGAEEGAATSRVRLIVSLDGEDHSGMEAATTTLTRAVLQAGQGI